jgi:capsular exopolysaccharide synthesis family protein
MADYMRSAIDSKESIDLSFRDYLLVIKRRWITAMSIFAGTVAASMLVAALLKPAYQAQGRILFKNSSFKVVGDNLLPNNIEGGASADLKPLVANQNPLATQVEIMSSPLLLNRTIEKLNLKNDRGERLQATELQTNLVIKIVPGTDLLQIGYEDGEPNQTASVVNTLMNLYVENDLLTNRNEAETIGRFMSEQLPQTQLNMNTAEIALRKFKQQNNIVDLGEEAKIAVSTIGNLEAGIITARSQLKEIKAQSQELHQKVNLNARDAMTFSATSQSPAIQGILTQLQELDRQIAIESSRFSDRNPIIVSLEEKKIKLNKLLDVQISSATGSKVALQQGVLRVGELKQNLIKELLQSEVQRTGATKKLASLEKALADYKKRVRVMPQLVQTQRQLEKQLEVSQSTYRTLLKKVQEIQLAKSNNISNARIVNSAIVPEQSDPVTKNIIVSFGLLMGALFSTGAVAYLAGKERSSIPSQDASKLFRSRLLGAMPPRDPNEDFGERAQSSKVEFAIRDLRKSLTSEESQIIQFNLRFANSAKIIKVITITSTAANTEKSKKAANLAAAIAGLGQKVLLIDADIRTPYQHQFWKLPLEKGLSEILVGNSNFRQVAWTVMENLDILTAGAGASQPFFSVESHQMQSLIHEISHLYDFAIVDTPPLLISANAMNMERMNDTILTIDLQDDFTPVAV